MKASCTLVSGTFFGGEIENGTFHAEQITPGVFNHLSAETLARWDAEHAASRNAATDQSRDTATGTENVPPQKRSADPQPAPASARE